MTADQDTEYPYLHYSLSSALLTQYTGYELNFQTPESLRLLCPLRGRRSGPR
jgi:hypothetical protein